MPTPPYLQRMSAACVAVSPDDEEVALQGEGVGETSPDAELKINLRTRGKLVGINVDKSRRDGQDTPRKTRHGQPCRSPKA